jgi:type IX secretion system PorP/SprF family membrane protein
MKGLVLLVLLFAACLINAQPMTQYNLYPFNPDFANPAATGSTTCLDLTVTDMHQWAGIAGTPNVQSFSIQQGIVFSKTKKHGLGANLIRDINGPSKSFGGELLYSFHMLIGSSQTTWLSLGLSGNIEQRRLDESGFSPVFDPLVTGGMVQELAYNVSAGSYLYSNNYFAGFAVYNLLPVNTNLGMGYGAERYYLSIQGGYLFAGKKSPFTLQTSFQASIGTAVYQFDLNNKIWFENNLWTALTLRKYLGEFETAGQNVIVFIGYDWKNWRFSYDYNFDINGTQFHHYGTHQLSLGYRICRNDIGCPAYR